MTHKISITTVEALLICKALGMDMQNEVDNAMAEIVTDRIKTVVDKDLKRAEPTDLTNKCGSCIWAKPKYGTYIDCVCPSRSPNWFARTKIACQKYEPKEKE